MEWFVYVGDFNGGCIKKYNALNDGILAEMADYRNKDRSVFEERLRMVLMGRYWSRCEWEIILSDWPPSKSFKKEKVDVYDQLCLNWDLFVDYVYLHRDEIPKREKKK